jgi:hypothetical protein
MKKNSIILSIVILFTCQVAFAQWTNGTNINNTNTGHVGIGTTTMPGKLTVKSDYYYGPTPGGIVIQSGFNDNEMHLNCLGSYGTFAMHSASGIISGFNFIFGPTNGNGNVVFKSDGNVGIGTSLGNNPNNYKLAVKGRVGAWEVQVENTSTAWADYVFAPEYKLMPLLDVEHFINTNRHLPEVPSADDVNKNGGHNLGEMDVILLKKVEELTLYMIEQNKQIQELKEENAAQKKEIELLKTR